MALLWRLAPLLLRRGLWLSCRAVVLVERVAWRPDLIVAAGLPADGLLRSPPLVIVELVDAGEPSSAALWRDAGAGVVWEVGECVRVHRGEGARTVGAHRELRVPRTAVDVPVAALLAPMSADGTNGRRAR